MSKVNVSTTPTLVDDDKHSYIMLIQINSQC